MGLSQTGRQMAALGRRIRLLADRALVRIISDDMNRQNLQVQTLADATNDDVERFQNYGLTSVPPAGSEAIVLAIGGQRENLVAVVVEDKRCRPRNLEPGEVRLYHADGLSFISLKKDGVIQVTGKSMTADIDGPLTVSAKKLVFNAAEMTFNGAAKFIKDVVISGKSFLKHFHKDGENRNTTEPQ
ncbi:TPA: phage baseplate assembly protein V [Citrobacter amalonaticus]